MTGTYGPNDIRKDGLLKIKKLRELNKPKPPKAGDCYMDDTGPYRIMAVAEGYCMCRRRGMSPFLRTIKQIMGCLCRSLQRSKND
jgi:hypothetical protein